MAKQYDQKFKDEVVAFIVEYNKEKGRGGQSAAAKKWNLNPITVRNWLEKAGVPTAGKGSKKKRTAKKAGRRTKSSAGAASSGSSSASSASSASGASGASGGSVNASLKRMVAIQDQITELQREYDALKAKI